jgi:hypothetical protein
VRATAISWPARRYSTWRPGATLVRRAGSATFGSTTYTVPWTDAARSSSSTSTTAGVPGLSMRPVPLPSPLPPPARTATGPTVMPSTRYRPSPSVTAEPPLCVSLVLITTTRVASAGSVSREPTARKRRTVPVTLPRARSTMSATIRSPSERT